MSFPSDLSFPSPPCICGTSEIDTCPIHIHPYEVNRLIHDEQASYTTRDCFNAPKRIRESALINDKSSDQETHQEIKQLRREEQATSTELLTISTRIGSTMDELFYVSERHEVFKRLRIYDPNASLYSFSIECDRRSAEIKYLLGDFNRKKMRLKEIKERLNVVNCRRGLKRIVLDTYFCHYIVTQTDNTPSHTCGLPVDQECDLCPEHQKNIKNVHFRKDDCDVKVAEGSGDKSPPESLNIEGNSHSILPDSGSLRNDVRTHSFIETPHFEESARCISTVFNPSLTEMSMSLETRIELYDLVDKICNTSDPNNGSDYLYQLLRETIQRTVIAEESRRRTAQSNGREINETERSLRSAYTNRRKNALIIFRHLNEYASRMQLPRIEQIYINLDRPFVRRGIPPYNYINQFNRASDHLIRSSTQREREQDRERVVRFASSTATIGERDIEMRPSSSGNSVDSSAINANNGLTSTEIGDDAAAGDDLGQNADSATADRVEHIAEVAGLHDRRGEKRAAVEHSDRPFPRKKVFVHEEVREEYNEEMIFRRLWEDFKTEMFSDLRLDKAIQALQAVIIVSEKNDDFDNVVKYESMMIQIKEARDKKDDGLSLRELKFNWKN